MMNHLHIQFDPELNLFLSKHQRDQRFEHRFKGNPSIKDLIESLGIPHTEIAAMRVNDDFVDFTYQVQSEDEITVRSFESLRLSNLENCLLANDHSSPRFILDVHLGKLTSYLRLLGFDCLYDSSNTDENLAQVASQEKRILLSRDRGLLKRKIVHYGYLVRSLNPREQISEVLERYQFYNHMAPFTRCPRCNGRLVETTKEAVANRLKPGTAQFYDSFSICENCNQVYWKGSYFEKLHALLEQFQSFPQNSEID